MIRARLAVLFFVPFGGVAAQQSAADAAMASYASLFHASFDTAAMSRARLGDEWKRIGDMFARLRHHRWHAVALLNAANAYRALDDEDAWLETLQTLLAGLRQMRDTALEGNVRFDIARIYRALVHGSGFRRIMLVKPPIRSRHR